MNLVELTRFYYEDHLYNCAEAVLRAANDYYYLDLHYEDMKMIGGYGAGMFMGMTCGALAANVAVITKMIIKTKVREQMDEIKPAVREAVKIFDQHLQGTTCAQLKPKYFSKEKVCLQTTLLAAEALEKTVKELHLD